MTIARGLRWKVTGVGLVVALVALGPIARSQTTQSNEPTVGFEVLKSRFLSTERASGSLVVRNTTSERLGYDPFRSAAAGWLDATAFLRAHTFAANMTGNTLAERRRRDRAVRRHGDRRRRSLASR